MAKNNKKPQTGKQHKNKFEGKSGPKPDNKSKQKKKSK